MRGVESVTGGLARLPFSPARPLGFAVFIQDAHDLDKERNVIGMHRLHDVSQETHLLGLRRVCPSEAPPTRWRAFGVDALEEVAERNGEGVAQPDEHFKRRQLLPPLDFADI